MDLRLNASRRSIKLSVHLVFDLDAGRFKFLGENLLGAGAVENELSTFDSLCNYQCYARGGGGGAHGIVWGLFSVFGYPDETLFLVFDILHQP